VNTKNKFMIKRTALTTLSTFHW